MNQKKITKIIAAAATAASTAFLASTVAMETATAATFTLSDSQWGEITIEYGDSTTETLVRDLGQWTKVTVGGEDWEWGTRTILGGDLEVMGWMSRDGKYYLLDVRNRVIGKDFGVAEFVETPAYWSRVPPGSITDRLRHTDTWEVSEIKKDKKGATRVPEPGGALALGMLGVGAVASRLRRRS